MIPLLIIGWGWFACFASFVSLIWALSGDKSVPSRYKKKVLYCAATFAILFVAVIAYTLPRVQVITRLSSGEDSADEPSSHHFEPGNHAK